MAGKRKPLKNKILEKRRKRVPLEVKKFVEKEIEKIDKDYGKIYPEN